MKNVFIKYNPYTVSTELEIEGVTAEGLAAFKAIQEGVRLQEWIEPGNEWLGFFGTLYQCMNSPEAIHIHFQGTEMDFHDLQAAGQKYGEDFDGITYELAESNHQDDRLAQVQAKLDELMEGPYEELKDQKIQDAFKKAISSDFEVVVVAPMSSGKSTLINSILGMNLLPAVNSATTATITRIKNEDDKEQFTVSCQKKNGKVLADHEPATLQLLDNLNQQAKDIECINVEGNIPNIPAGKVNIVFVDTPGGNNSRDARHMAIMKDAISDENKGMILYVFNFTQLETGDCDQILSLVAKAMCNTTTNKQIRDRFIFVCNKMDAQNPETEPYDNILDEIKKFLKEKGISDPNLFFTCADACKLIRMKKSGVRLNDSDEDRLYGYLRPFNRESRQLFQYASIPDEVKADFEKQIEELKENGDRDNLDIAEINSGIPALENAIRTYIEKYAVAIKVKNVHDVFMRKVDELQMVGRSQACWAKSQEEYEKMRKELAEKKETYEKNQQLQKFKEKIDAIQSDYSKAMALEDEFIAYIRGIAYSYPENVKKSELENLLNEFHDQLVQAGDKVEAEFGQVLEDTLYRQCKEVLGEYKAYIKELDQGGMLNIGDYNFKKTQRLAKLDTSEIESEEFSDEYVHSEIVDVLKIKKKGFLNAIKRLIDNIDGWDIVNVREDFVSINKYIKEILTKLERELVYEFEKEINRAKTNENKVKEFVKDELSDIDKRVKEEYERIQNMTEDKSVLEERAKKDRSNLDWLTKFVADMNSILDI